MAGPDSLNTQVQDAIILSQVRALQAGNVLRAEIRQRLDTLRQELLGALASADPTSPVRLSTRNMRLDRFMKEDALPRIRQAYRTMDRASARDLTNLVMTNVEQLRTNINTLAGVPLLSAGVPSETVHLLVTTTPFPSVPTPTMASTTAPEWWARQATKVGQTVTDTLMTGVRREESLAQLVTRLRGTAKHHFTDGVMAVAQRDAEALAQTALSMGVHQGRVALWDANAEVIKGIVHISTLDNRTSVVCTARSGAQYTVPEHQPIGHTLPYLSGVPYHWKCRSTFNTIFHSYTDLLGAKGARFDQQLAALPEGTRASMDGQVPASLTFDAWLQRQPTRVQQRLLGTTRLALWKAGDITLPQLLDQVTGRVLRLDELA